MSNNFFKRVAEFRYGNYALTNELEMEFSIPFDDGPEVNMGELTIYNLSDSTIHSIKKGMKCYINAGYEGDTGTILTGTVESISTDNTDMDKPTKIVIADSNDAWIKKEVKKTYRENIRGAEIIKDLVKLSGLAVGSLVIPRSRIFPSGKSVEGSIAKNLDELVTDAFGKMHITRGKIYINERGKGTPSGVLLDANSGLIGTPTPIEESEPFKEVRTRTEMEEKQVNGRTKKVPKMVTEEVDLERIYKGYKVRCLLNHRLHADSVLQIKSKTANGEYRIKRGTHNGSDFITEVEVFPI